MKILVVGTGFVGLTHAAVCSEFGHLVYAYDIDQTRIAAYQSGDRQRIERYVNEPELADVVTENLNHHLFFVSEIEPILEGTQVIFLCLPTPPLRSGATDLSYYLKAAHQLGELLANRRDQRRVVLVNKSTVPVGTARKLQKVLQEHHVPNFGVASNPSSYPKAMRLNARASPIAWSLARIPAKILPCCAMSTRSSSIMYAFAISKPPQRQPRPSSTCPTRCS